VFAAEDRGGTFYAQFPMDQKSLLLDQPAYARRQKSFMKCFSTIKACSWQRTGFCFL